MTLDSFSRVHVLSCFIATVSWRQNDHILVQTRAPSTRPLMIPRVQPQLLHAADETTHSVNRSTRSTSSQRRQRMYFLLQYLLFHPSMQPSQPSPFTILFCSLDFPRTLPVSFSTWVCLPIATAKQCCRTYDNYRFCTIIQQCPHERQFRHMTKSSLRR